MRNLKALGLALVAVFAMSAMTAAAAQAESPAHFTAGSSTNPATITGEQTEKHVFSRSGRTVTCETAHFDGHELVEGSATELTIVPTYKECHSVVLGTKFPATVTVNSCDYLFTGTKVEDRYEVVTHLECEGADEVEVHIYSDENHENEICTIDIPPQTLETIELTNKENEPHDVLAHINITNIVSKETKPGLLCGPENSETAALTGTATLKAIDQNLGTQVPLTVSG